MTATLTPSDTTDTVTWESSDTSVATVSSSGLVTGVALGSATITATAGEVTATCSVVIATATLVSISAVYTQSGTVYDIDSLDSLKSDLVVTAHWDNNTTSTVASADYTLSGTLTEGTSTITVSYSGKTTTFNVTVSSPFTYVLTNKTGSDYSVNTAIPISSLNFAAGDYIEISVTANTTSQTLCRLAPVDNSDIWAYDATYKFLCYGTLTTIDSIVAINNPEKVSNTAPRRWTIQNPTNVTVDDPYVFRLDKDGFHVWRDIFRQ